MARGERRLILRTHILRAIDGSGSGSCCSPTASPPVPTGTAIALPRTRTPVRSYIRPYGTIQTALFLLRLSSEAKKPFFVSLADTAAGIFQYWFATKNALAGR